LTQEFIEQKFVEKNAIEKREYQVNLAKQAVDENCIIVLNFLNGRNQKCE